MVNYWIQKAVKRERRGKLHRRLGIPVSEKIPVTLLRRIKSAPIGTTIINPTKTGRKRIKVTRLLKKEAVLADTLRKLKKR